MSMTRDEARQRAARMAAENDRIVATVSTGMGNALAELQRDAEALRLLLSPPTCATCQHNYRDVHGDDHECARGVTRPIERQRDGTWLADFGCLKHEPRAGADPGGV